ncbi:MAG: hypothetical protein ACRENI_01105 [Gemmatimonadaceae bacterium]
MRRRVILRVAIATVAVILGCAGGASTQSDRAPVVGVWNGPHASLVLTDAAGSIEYDCAHGALHSPVHADRNGGFAVTGVHVREHGGPIGAGEVPDSVPARYVGEVRGDL